MPQPAKTTSSLPPAQPAPAERPGSLRLVGLAILVLALVGGALAMWRFKGPAVPPPPLVNTTGFDPAISAAISQARESIVATPRSADAWGKMGMTLLVHQVRAEARDCFQQAALLAPKEHRWPYFLGVAQMIDNPAAAVTNLHTAVQLFERHNSSSILTPEETAMRLRLADTLLNLSKLDEAQKQYQSVYERDPSSPSAALGLGKIANANDRLDQAIEYLLKAKSDPVTRKAAHRLLVSVYQRLGRTAEAQQLSAVLTSLPQDLPFLDPYLIQMDDLKTGEMAWIDFGDNLIKNGRVAEAAQLLERTVQAYPKSDRAMFYLGRARLRLGDVVGAESILIKAVQHAPHSVEAQMQLGVILMNRGRLPEAQRAFRAALEVKPNLPEGWYNLGLSVGPQNRAESIAAFREAIRLKPNLLEAYLALALVLRTDGQRDAAAETLRQALALQPEPALKQKMLEQLKLVSAP